MRAGIYRSARLTRAIPDGRLALGLVLGVALLGALAGPASAGAAETPEKDPFYKAPGPGEEHENWRSEPPGTVLKKRALDIYGYSVDQLLFRSTNGRGEPIVAVTTVGIPRNPWAGSGERPFISYQEAIDSLGINCNPSYTLQEGSDYEEGEIVGAMERGWYVNVPDHEGEDMEWEAGANSAHITLDSIRAAYNAGIGISPKNPLGVVGYSGGGNATAWTMEEQPSYAPELHIVAGAPGGIAVNLKETAEYNEGGPGFGLVLGATLGISRGYSELELFSLLNSEGEAAMAKISKACLREIVESAPLKKLPEYTKPEYPEPLNLPKVEKVMTATSLATEPSMPNHGVPAYPVLLWQSKADELIPPAGVEHLANYYCSEGVDVTFELGAQGEHISYAVDNITAVYAWMEAIFAGSPEASTCGVNASENTAIDSGPSGKTEEDSATFTYSAEPDVAGTTFECRLDGAEFESCPTSGVTYSDLAAGEHSFQVRSLTASGDKDLSPATRTFAVTGADVGVSVSAAPNPATVKKRLTYTVTVQNAGPEAATGVVLTNVLAGSLKIRSGQSSQGTCTVPKGKHAGDTVTCSLGALQAGAKATVTLVVRPTAVGTVSDSSSVTDSGPPDRNPSNNSATQSTTVNPRK